MDFSINSSISGNSLKVVSLEPDYMFVELVGIVSVKLRVCTFTDEMGLPNFLRRLSKFNRPWKTEQEWQSLEHQFRISATCSNLGEVYLEIELSDMHGHPEQWSVKTSIVTELGQLEHLANNAESFFNHDRN